MREKALEWIEKQIRKTRINIGHAEQKSNSTDELTCLYGKLEMLEWISQVVLAGVEVAPVVHAMWVRQDDTYTRFQCGACKAKNFDRRWDFCPVCGAKMDGGKKIEE